MVYVSALCHGAVIRYLKETGRPVRIMKETPCLGSAISSHPDLRICRLGGSGHERALFCGTSELGGTYPENARFCAVFLSRYMLHRLDITHESLLTETKRRGLTPVHVRQGYTKCSTVVVDGSAVISSDAGICAAISQLGDVALLSVSPGYVSLPGFDYGFLGGASGRVGDEIIFNGDLSAHPDHERIRSFIDARGLRLRHFPGLPLTDVGTIIEYEEDDR